MPTTNVNGGHGASRLCPPYEDTQIGLPGPVNNVILGLTLAILRQPVERLGQSLQGEDVDGLGALG